MEVSKPSSPHLLSLEPYADDLALSLVARSCSAGPYTFEVSPSAQGGDWVAMTVQQNVPGRFLGLSRAVAEDFPVEATIPAGTSQSPSFPLCHLHLSTDTETHLSSSQLAPEALMVRPA